MWQCCDDVVAICRGTVRYRHKAGHRHGTQNTDLIIDIVFPAPDAGHTLVFIDVDDHERPHRPLVVTVHGGGSGCEGGKEIQTRNTDRYGDG